MLTSLLARDLYSSNYNEYVSYLLILNKRKFNMTLDMNLVKKLEDAANEKEEFVYSFKKYKGYRMANTGLDPHGNFLSFIKKDIVSNIDVHKNNDATMRSA